MLSFITIIGLLSSLHLTYCLYLRYFHPLARYSGPFLASFTNLWYLPPYLIFILY